MKKYFFIALILTLAIAAYAQPNLFLPRVVLQKCGDMNNLTLESPYVANTGTTTSPNFQITVLMVETGETIGTNLGTSATNLRISRIGNGTTTPYYTGITMNLQAFAVSGWNENYTLRYTINYIGTPVPNAVDLDNTWDTIIPNRLTSVLNIQDPVQGVPPLITTPPTYTLNVNGPVGYTYNSGTAWGAVVDSDDEVNDLIGTVLTPDPIDPLTVGTWNPPTYTVQASDFVDGVATITFAIEPPVVDTYVYTLHINGPDGYAVTGPNTELDGITDYTETAATAAALIGNYTIAAAPAGQYWLVNPIEVTEAMFVPVATKSVRGQRSSQNNDRAVYYFEATIEFALGTYPAFTVVVNGPAGYTVNGLPFPATFTDNNDFTNDLIGLILTPDATVDGTWNPLTITVAAGDFIQGTVVYSFELVPIVQPITYTVVVNGPAGYTVNGNAFPYPLVDANDTVNDLIGTILTPDATVDGTWNPLTITVAAADFDPQTNTATYMFELIPCVPQYSWEIVAYDGYDQSDQTTPLAATIWYCDQLFAVWGDPNYTWVNIGTTPLMVWYPCGLWQLGTYRVSHPGYNDDTWVWNQIVWENIFEDYAYTDWYGFRNVPRPVPVELSSFTAVNVDRNVRLTWVSQTETEMIGYRVLRSNVNDLSSAEAITPTAIAATNTSTTQTYNYTDTEVVENNQYYYWLESVDYNASEFFGPVSVFIEVSAPAVTNVSQIVKSAYPNPFKANSNTTIVVDVKTGETGTVTVYNILGQVVRTFSVNAGTNNVSWNGKDSRGNACGSGIYFYKLSTPSVTDTKKLVIVK